MRPCFVAIALLLLISVFTNPVSAHRNYFSVVGKIGLPNGDMGEVRYLTGEGVFGPDALRVLIVDQKGRLVAVSEHSKALSLLCSPNRDCTIFDGWRGRVLELDHKSFRADASRHVLSNSEDELHVLGVVPGGWGLIPRPPTWREWLVGYIGLARERSYALLFTLVIGFMVGIFIRVAQIGYRTGRMYWSEMPIAIVGLTALGAFVTLLTSVLNYRTPAVLWLPSLALGLLSFWLLHLYRHRPMQT